MAQSQGCSEMSSVTAMVFLVTCIRWLVSLNPYSGLGKPPMFGDYEAQRHWMEITLNLPTKEWYHNTTQNDLQYWGLDYPPLTAYHSWLCGFVANKMNSSWMELVSSRGLEDPTLKLFMRYTVIVADLLIYIPAVFVYFNSCLPAKFRAARNSAVFLTLTYPGLILIDHGHFQYNCISLGFALWAVVFISKERDLLASILFVMALNYKQMELYHAMPFFCYLLGKCFSGSENWFLKLTKLGAVVLLSFAICWYPFLWNTNNFLQVIHRLFPFARGLYEDKVASFWCTLSLVIKLKHIFATEFLMKLCLITTSVALMPSSVHLLVKPSVDNFKYALVNSSLVFFLFSFQVHEKSILLAALPVCLFLHKHSILSLWFLVLSTFSMLPLLLKDDLLLPYVALTAFFILCSLLLFSSLCEKSSNSPTPLIIKAGVTLSSIGMIILTVTPLTVNPPNHLPDLFPVLISAYSCVHFLLFLFCFHYLQFTSDRTSKVPSKEH